MVHDRISPICFQFAFALDRVEALAPQHPELAAGA
jgi:hypothetical protein